MFNSENEENEQHRFVKRIAKYEREYLSNQFIADHLIVAY